MVRAYQQDILSVLSWDSSQQGLGDKQDQLYFRGLWYAEGVWITPGTLYGSWSAVVKQNEWWMWGVCRHGILILRWWRVNRCLRVTVHSTAWLDNAPRINWGIFLYKANRSFDSCHTLHVCRPHAQQKVQFSTVQSSSPRCFLVVVGLCFLWLVFDLD